MTFFLSPYRKAKKLLCCPHPTDRKMRKNRVVFFYVRFVFNGLKKHLYMRFDCIPPEFSPFRNLKNIQLNSLTVRKNRPTDPIFKLCACEGNITNFFGGPNDTLSKVNVSFVHSVSRVYWFFILWVFLLKSPSTSLEPSLLIKLLFTYLTDTPGSV